MVRASRTTGRLRRRGATTTRASERTQGTRRTVRRGRSSSSSNRGPETPNQLRRTANGVPRGTTASAATASGRGRGRGRGARQLHAQPFWPTSPNMRRTQAPQPEEPPRFFAAYHQPPSPRPHPEHGSAFRPMAYYAQNVDRNPRGYRLTAEFPILEEFFRSMLTFQQEMRENIDNLWAGVRRLEAMRLPGGTCPGPGMDGNMPTNYHY